MYQDTRKFQFVSKMTRIFLKFQLLRIIHFYPPTSHAELRDFKLQYRCIPNQDLIRKELIIAHIGEKRPTNPWVQLPEGMDYFGNIYRSRDILKTNLTLLDAHIFYLDAVVFRTCQLFRFKFKVSHQQRHTNNKATPFHTYRYKCCI